MTTKTDIIKKLKKDYPVIKIGSDELGYSELNKDDYEIQISLWADGELAIIQSKTDTETKAAQRQAILDRLGLTADEAKLLLG